MGPKLQLASIGLIGLVTGAAPAIAQIAQASVQEPSIVVTHKLRPSPDLIVRTVYIGDLDLKSAAAQKEMEKRVNAAVEEMCAIPTPIPGQERNMTRPCRDEAWDSAPGADDRRSQTGKRVLRLILCLRNRLCAREEERIAVQVDIARA